MCVCACVRARIHTQLLNCVWLCDTIDHSPPGSSVHGIPQAGTPEWLAISSSRWSSWARDQTCISGVCCIGRRVLYHYRHLEMGLNRRIIDKESSCQRGRHKRHQFNFLVRKIPWRRKWQPSILTCRIPWTEKPGGLWSMEWQRVRQDWDDLAHRHVWRQLLSQLLPFPSYRLSSGYSQPSFKMGTSACKQYSWKEFGARKSWVFYFGLLVLKCEQPRELFLKIGIIPI